MSAGQLFTVAQTAERLGVHQQTLYEWVWGNVIPHRRLGPTGRVIRIAEEDLEDYLTMQRRGDEGL